MNLTNDMLLMTEPNIRKARIALKVAKDELKEAKKRMTEVVSVGHVVKNLNHNDFYFTMLRALAKPMNDAYTVLQSAVRNYKNCKYEHNKVVKQYVHSLFQKQQPVESLKVDNDIIKKCRLAVNLESAKELLVRLDKIKKILEGEPKGTRIIFSVESAMTTVVEK